MHLLYATYTTPPVRHADGQAFAIVICQRTDNSSVNVVLHRLAAQGPTCQTGYKCKQGAAHSGLALVVCCSQVQSCQHITCCLRNQGQHFRSGSWAPRALVSLRPWAHLCENREPCTFQCLFTQQVYIHVQ